MEQKTNTYSRIVTVATIVFIMVLVVTNFIVKEKCDITREIIICIVLIIVLGLSELFDNLSIPKLLSLSKNNKKLEKENNELKNENTKIMEQLVKINTNNSNKQNVYVNSISKESSTDINDVVKEQKEISEVNYEIVPQKGTSTMARRNIVMERAKYREALGIMALKKFLKDKENVQYNVVLTNNEFNDASIMKDSVSFDACVQDNGINVFYNVMSFKYSLRHQDIYQLLRMVDSYKKFTNTPAKLVLLVPEIDEDLKKIFGEMVYISYMKYTLRKFEPAITNQLLEVKEFAVTKKELDEYINENESKKSNN